MMLNKFYPWIFGTILITFLLNSCNHNATKNIMLSVLPHTEAIDQSGYTHFIYISKSANDSTGNGSQQEPFQSVNYALSQIHDAASDNRIALFISQGEYSSATIQLKEYVDLYGGFDALTWQRDIKKFPTTLSGAEEHRILIAANEAKVDGFIIANGIEKGKGAALFCDGTSPQISNNIFQNNKTLAPENWNPKYWHETAHDGGAVYGQNGSSPIIRNNIFVNNKTENGRGAAVAFDGKCTPVIKENVFLSNVAGLKDPMRSSDGGAVSIFNWSSAVIDNNIFISNRAESKNDGGAVFIALWSSANVTDNLFVDNHSGDDAGALFVGGQEHRYDGPLDPIPPRDKFFVSIKNNTFIGNHHGGTNSGAMRFTMESRGEFIANTLAHNNGVYFQRSEVRVADNIILDNFLFIETKEGLQKGVIENNLLWADYDQLVDADVKNNNMLQPVAGNGNFHHPPHFINDGFEITSLSTNYKKQNFSTLINLDKEKYSPNQLQNRVVKAGNKWGVVKSNTADTITLWGNFLGEVNFTVLPTYRLVNQ